MMIWLTEPPPAAAAQSSSGATWSVSTLMEECPPTVMPFRICCRFCSPLDILIGVEKAGAVMARRAVATAVRQTSRELCICGYPPMVAGFVIGGETVQGMCHLDGGTGRRRNPAEPRIRIVKHATQLRASAREPRTGHARLAPGVSQRCKISRQFGCAKTVDCVCAWAN